MKKVDNNISHCAVINDDNLPCEKSQYTINNILTSTLTEVHDDATVIISNILPSEEFHNECHITNIGKSGMSTQNIKDELKPTGWKKSYNDLLVQSKMRRLNKMYTLILSALVNSNYLNKEYSKFI